MARLTLNDRTMSNESEQMMTVRVTCSACNFVELTKQIS